MDLDNIPNDERGFTELYEHLRQYVNCSFIHPLLSVSVSYESPDRYMGARGMSLPMMTFSSEEYQISHMNRIQYMELLRMVAKGFQSDGKGHMKMVEYVEVDKSEALYASMVRELEDRHRAILEAVDSMLDSDIPADQAKAIAQMREWRESLPQPKEEALTDGQPKFRLPLDLEL